MFFATDIVSLIKSDRKIYAIKELRAKFGWTLKDAKDYADGIQNDIANGQEEEAISKLSSLFLKQSDINRANLEVQNIINKKDNEIKEMAREHNVIAQNLENEIKRLKVIINSYESTIYHLTNPNR